MTPRQPHPKRCETCEYHVLQKLMKYPHCCDHPLMQDDETGLAFIDPQEYIRISIMGCASHSSTPAAEPKTIGAKCTIEDCTCNKFVTCDECRVAFQEVQERQKEWSVVTKEIYEKGKIEGAKSERERYASELIEKIEKYLDEREQPKCVVLSLQMVEKLIKKSLRAQEEEQRKIKLRHCEFASWFDGYFLCKSQNDCEFQEDSGLTFYCGREDANNLSRELLGQEQRKKPEEHPIAGSVR